ncbi:proteoglycan 4 isoform X3 [Girardinichthys multiradiatus]|uniref:proteoglycan 4 isoform X3 n=1 Tax=Girardinichthys multiradiatus TaxID=208333 RepID=UPI001FAD0D47|nr:proteoglycan 4 isoform X3 [Girardinichthys multiradiatus]
MAGMYGCFKGRNRDSAAMASGSPDLVTSQEPAEVREDCSGKKKSKFQTFKKLFARKKKKEPQDAGAEDGLKGSQSSDNVSKTSENNALIELEKEKVSGSKVSLGNKALSHDSVFVSNSSEANEGLGASQDSIQGKVKSLQLQLKQAIRKGSPPSLMCVKKTEEAGTMSEDDSLPCSPLDYTPLHSVKSKAERSSSNSLDGIESDEQLSCAASSRAVSPLVIPGDFSQPASPFVCLDNSAAKHKLGLRYKACNKRKPARRLELKTEEDSAVEEELTVSITEVEVLEEQAQQKAEDENGDQLKPETESEEEEEDEENKSQKDSSRFLLRDKEGEDEPEAERDVSHAPHASCPPESSFSEEEASDDQHVPSSSTSSRSSSLDSPSVTPEPPSGPREYLSGPPGFLCAVDNNSDTDSLSGEEDMMQESTEEESSFLDEVLSSLKTSHSTDVDISGVLLEMEKMEKEEKVIEIDERVEMKGEEAEADDPTGCEATALYSVMSDQTTEDEEEVLLHSLQEEEVAVEEEVKRTEEEADAEEEEEIVVERFIQHSDEEAGQEEEAEDVQSEEENNMVSSQTVSQQETEEQAIGKEEKEAAEAKKGPEIVGEDWENKVEENSVQVDELGEEEEEEEEGKGDKEEMTEIHDSEDEEFPCVSPIQGTDEGDDGATHDDTTTDVDEQIHSRMNEVPEILNENFGAVEEVDEVELKDHKSEGEETEEEVERCPSDANQSGEDLVREKDETSPPVDVKPVESEEEGGAFSRLPPLLLSESRSNSHSDESPISSPSKTTTLHINLASPTSEKNTSPFELRPAAANPSDSVTESLSPADETTESTEEQPEALKDQEEKEKQSELEQNNSAPALAQEGLAQPTDQSKVRFTIATAWQRLQSPPTSPSAVPAAQDGELKAACQNDQDQKAEPDSLMKAELLSSPVRGRSSGSFTSKLHSSAPSSPAEPQTAEATRTSESAAVAEANSDSPFGVRLRKTSALLRLSSEEVDSEPQVESPTHSPSCKAESLQPVNSKPSASHPISNKPALPKKPEVHGDAVVKLRRISEPPAARGVSGGSDPPSWISMAKQKQKVYKETPLNEIAVRKEEQEKKPALPTSVGSAAIRGQSNNKQVEPISKGSVKKETRRTLSGPTPVPPQLSKSPLQKPEVPPAPAKPTPPPDSPQMPPSSPAPLTIPLKSPASTTPSILSKTPPVPSTSISPRTVPEKPASRAPGLSRQAVPPQRSSPTTALPQDEPPWMALAKKKAKAWSEMPQIVQ